MKIKDIVNRVLVNLTNCEHEPIHIPGSIQPHGFLIGYKSDDQIIDFCSGNVADFIDLTKEQLLSRTCVEVFGKDQVEKIDRFKKQRIFATPCALTIAGKKFNATIHESNENVILEFEALSSDSVELSVFYNQTRQFVSSMEESTSLQLLCQGVADETRKITGYDRVMIYKFDNDYNGEVFAESKREDIESFFGLHYPHTDIPVQARILYEKNLLRLIVDVNYVPVPLYTNDNGAIKTLDLSLSILRSVSPIHVQYLHNIGVGATLTISLLHQKRLWGLIACHHYSPKYLDAFTRTAAQLQGHFLTSQINVRQVAEEHELNKNVNKSLDRMSGIVSSMTTENVGEVVSNEDLLKLCGATGVAIFIGDAAYSHGVVPAMEDLQKLKAALWSKSQNYIVSSKVNDLFPETAPMADSVAGVLLHRFGVNDDVGIMWTRAESLEEVKWAGDPSKAIIKDEKGLSPRKSFELWKEMIRYQSNEWLSPELSAASNFSKTFERQINLLHVAQEQNRYRLLSEQLKEINAELENINWIGTHDLKEPLRKIQIFASRLLSREGDALPREISETISKMNASAGKMQTLLADILSYSRLLHSEDAIVKVDLAVIFKSILDDVQSDFEEVGGKIVVEHLPVIDGVEFFVKQLFANLLGNALKFRKQDVPLVVRISSAISVKHFNGKETTFLQVTMEDNGIGFEPEFNNVIFNVFTRLHSHSEYSGSGIGLSLCKRIMHNLHGFMTAHGRKDKGAQFDMFFPL